MGELLSRIAGAPITWGVDGSPGWGHLMPAERVLEEMSGLGLRATELGPDGYLPTDPDMLAEFVGRYELSVVAGFVPALLYRPDRLEAELDYVARAARQLQTTGSRVMVLGASGDQAGYDHPVTLDDDEWRRFVTNLTRVMDLAGEAGLATALHPHMGMVIETQHHVERLLGDCDVDLCLDTGHLFVAGADPLEVARSAAGRIRHVHLKDVDDAFAGRVRAGEIPFRQAVIEGLFKPLGSGDVDIEGLVRYLEGSGYDGWYVIEQDQALSAEPAAGEGPIADATTSTRFLQELAARL